MKQFICGLIVGAALFVAACNNPASTPLGSAVSTPPGTGMVRVNFSDGAARTIYPSKVFDRYVYTFTKVGASTGQVKTPNTNGIFTLETGNWNLSVNAYVNASIAARGSTAAAFTVSQNTLTDNIMVTLIPAVSTGAGTLNYSIEYPDASIIQTLTFTQVSGGASIDLQTGASTSSTGGVTTLTGTKSAVSAGYYLITAILKNSADSTLTAGKSEVVHIYNNLNTPVNFTFAADTFTAAINAATPAINTQPTGASYEQYNTAAALTVGASVTDGGNLSFQWYSNGTNSTSGGTPISGATGVSYTPSTAVVGTVYYYVVVSNTNNTVNGNTTTTATSNIISITVSPITVSGVTLNKSSLSLVVGASETLTAAVAPLNAANQAVTWSSSNSGIASVTSGVVTAVAPGTATITVTTDDGSRTASAAVTVPAPGTLAISIGFNFGAIAITGNDGSNSISRGADTSKPTSLTLSASGYTGVQWYVDGVLKTGATGNSITLSAAAYDIRNHSVTFTGVKDGIPYSQLLPFVVVQ
ncbi:Ig-like domain-containing protein [Breznakiellaceae bacterium SP9]